MRATLLTLLLLLAASSARAELKLGGYVKDLWQYSHSALDGRAYYLNTSRGRLTLDEKAAAFRAHVDYDQQVAAGSYFRTTEYRRLGYAPPAPWLGARQAISTGTTNIYFHRLYRGWMGAEDDRGALRVGRQRIAWGTGKIWNPTDVLNPLDPTSVELDERRGVDALYGRLGLGAAGQAELVWAPEDRWVDHAVLARLRAHREGLDASLLGGKIAGSTASYMVGGDFAGDLLSGTAHGEVAYFAPETRTPYWKADVGWDYAFRDGALTAEYYRMGNGQDDVRRYDLGAVREGREVGVGRDYVGANASWDVHPLVKLEAFLIANGSDGSTFASPSATVNPWRSLFLTAALRRYGGDKRTEYGVQPNQAVLMGQYFF